MVHSIQLLSGEFSSLLAIDKMLHFFNIDLLIGLHVSPHTWQLACHRISNPRESVDQEPLCLLSAGLVIHSVIVLMPTTYVQ